MIFILPLLQLSWAKGFSGCLGAPADKPHSSPIPVPMLTHPHLQSSILLESATNAAQEWFSAAEKSRSMCFFFQVLLSSW